MKKIGGVAILMLVTVLVMFGCSGIGGGTTASSDGGNSTSNPGGGSQSGPVNGFTINLVDSDASSHARYAITPSTPTKVRVVVTQWADVLTPQNVCAGTDDNGNDIPPCTIVLVPIRTLLWKDIVDQDYASSVTVGIPAGNNYALDVITYNQITSTTTTTNSIVSYGSVTNVNVATGGNQTVTMHTASAILSMAAPNPVTSKGKFDVTLNNALPFAPRYTMTMSVVPAIQGVNSSSVITTATKCTFTAPETFLTNEGVHLVGEFTINASFLNQREPQAQWTYGEEVDSSLIPLIPVTIPGL